MRYPDPTNTLRDNIIDLPDVGEQRWKPGWAPLDDWLARMGLGTTVEPWPWEATNPDNVNGG